MINGENFFYQPVKYIKVTYENIRKIVTGQGDDYTTGCLLDYPYFRASSRSKRSYSRLFTRNCRSIGNMLYNNF